MVRSPPSTDIAVADESLFDTVTSVPTGQQATSDEVGTFPSDQFAAVPQSFPLWGLNSSVHPPYA